MERLYGLVGRQAVGEGWSSWTEPGEGWGFGAMRVWGGEGGQRGGESLVLRPGSEAVEHGNIAKCKAGEANHGRVWRVGASKAGHTSLRGVGYTA